MDKQGALLMVLVFAGAASLAISQSDRDLMDAKLWALAIAAGSAAVVALLRPPSGPRPPTGAIRG